VEAFRPSLESALDTLFSGYRLTVTATPSVDPVLDRVEGPVNVEAESPATLIPLSREQKQLVHNESLLASTDLAPVPVTNNRRQQAAAILIAIIALLTSLLQFLR
jgi:hypothetical protein